jgi:hypothetical protein
MIVFERKLIEVTRSGMDGGPRDVFHTYIAGPIEIRTDPEKVCRDCGGIFPEWWVESVHGVRELRGRFWKAHLPTCPRLSR